MIKFDKDKLDFFMNYGFASENGTFDNLKLSPEDEGNRYFIQLYDFVTRNYDMKDKDVLEVGSGRGGGAAFLAKYKKPKKYIASDIFFSTVPAEYLLFIYAYVVSFARKQDTVILDSINGMSDTL